MAFLTHILSTVHSLHIGVHHFLLFQTSSSLDARYKCMSAQSSVGCFSLVGLEYLLSKFASVGDMDVFLSLHLY